MGPKRASGTHVPVGQKYPSPPVSVSAQTERAAGNEKIEIEGGKHPKEDLQTGEYIIHNAEDRSVRT